MPRGRASLVMALASAAGAGSAQQHDAQQALSDAVGEWMLAHRGGVYDAWHAREVTAQEKRLPDVAEAVYQERTP